MGGMEPEAELCRTKFHKRNQIRRLLGTDDLKIKKKKRIATGWNLETNKTRLTYCFEHVLHTSYCSTYKTVQINTNMVKGDS